MTGPSVTIATDFRKFKLKALGSRFCPLPDILQGNFKPDYYLKHIQKDLRLAISMGDMANHPTPMAAAANEVRSAAESWAAVMLERQWDRAGPGFFPVQEATWSLGNVQKVDWTFSRRPDG